MIMKNEVWDIRCPAELTNIFKVRRGYWFKVSKEQATIIAEVLSRAYNIIPPKVVVDVKKLRASSCNGMYCSYNKTIYMYARNHVKTVFHEFYHHLDSVTKGLYNSDDKRKFAWIFAEKMWDKLKFKEVNLSSYFGD